MQCQQCGAGLHAEHKQHLGVIADVSYWTSSCAVLSHGAKGEGAR